MRRSLVATALAGMPTLISIGAVSAYHPAPVCPAKDHGRFGDKAGGQSFHATHNGLSRALTATLGNPNC